MTINYLGKYDNLSLLWEAHPNGGIEGEYCYVGDQLLVWDKYENDWVEGSAEVLDVIPSEQPERESNNGLNCIGYFESEQQLWSQHPQGGVEGDYVVIAGKEYIWDKYNKEWREATEEDAAHFTAAVIVQDEAYEYSRLAITFMGSFENVSQIWKVYPQGGIEGGYIYLGEDKYIWDKYSYSWKPFEPTESSKLRPIDVTYSEGVVAYSEDYINYIGTFDNLDQVWEMYPNGGKDGDYILVNGERLKWNKYTSNWGEDESGDTSPARSVATIYGDLHVFNDLVIGEDLYARILEELSKKQWVQDNFTTKQWLLDQNYARQEWVLGQYEVLQDWVDQRNADIAKWILERNYISEGDISSETVMNLIETDEITITKKDGVLVAIASGGQGSVPIITTKDVNAIPSDQNVFSAAKAVATFLDTTKGGTVLEPVNFEKGIKIGGKDGIEIIYDIENNALCFGGNAYSLGGMTAGGVGSGGSGGGGGISYNRLDSWSDYSVDKAGYVLSALLGSDLNTRLSSIENAGYITQSALAPYALRSEIPSLEGYATLDALNTLSQTVVNFKSLFDSMFEKDSDGNIHAKLSLWSSGGITAGGVGSGGSGGGVSYDRLDAWSDYSADKAGYVLSALLGKDLDNRVSALANAGYITASYLAPYALRSEIPSLAGYFLASNFTKANIKSTLGISDWALASTKPTYTASEVGALGVNDTAINANKLGGYLPTTYMRASGQYADSLNDLTSLGIYRMSGTIKDSPTGAGGYGNLMVVRSNSWDTLSQLYFNANNNRIFVRSGTNSNFTSKDWSTLALTSDIPTKLSQLTDDVVAGKYLSKSGGKLVYSGAQGLEAERTDGAPTHIMFLGLVNGTSRQLGGFGMNGYNDPVYVNPNGIRHKVLTAENYSDYALSKYGGTINGSITANSFIGQATAASLLRKTTSSNTWCVANGNALDIYNSHSTKRFWFGYSLPEGSPYATNEWFFGASDGTGVASGKVNAATFIGNLTGTADRAFTQAILYGNRDVNLWDMDNSTARYFALTDAAPNVPSGVYALGSILMEYSWDINAGAQLLSHHSKNNIFYRSRWNGAFKDWREIAFTDSNVASATKLATPRTIWGQSFDGTQDVAGALTAPAITTNSLTIGGATITYDSVNEALCINGNMYALGGITAGGAGISAYSSLETRVARLEQQLNIS